MQDQADHLKRGGTMRVALESDVGMRRKNNQDFAGYFNNHSECTLSILCDGMGGHQAGDVASEMVVSHLGHAWSETHLSQTEEAKEWLKSAIDRENKRLVEKAEQFPDLEGMGTTLVAVAAVKDGFVVANIGDSRAYRLTNGEIEQMTEDHSLVQELIKSGEISFEEAENHPRKNVLTRSLGVLEELDIDLTTYLYQQGEFILLCSDGLTNMVKNEEIKEILTGTATLKEKVSYLVSLANERGGLDNITVMLIDFDKRKEGKEDGSW